MMMAIRAVAGRRLGSMDIRAATGMAYAKGARKGAKMILSTIALPTGGRLRAATSHGWDLETGSGRSEEHTSELQSRFDLVCRLLLEKKKKKPITQQHRITPTPPLTTSPAAPQL